MHTIVPGIVVRSHLLFFPRILIENDRLKIKDEIVWRKEREKYSWEYENGKRSVCDQLKILFMVYRDVKWEVCSISMVSSIFIKLKLHL